MQGPPKNSGSPCVSGSCFCGRPFRLFRQRFLLLFLQLFLQNRAVFLNEPRQIIDTAVKGCLLCRCPLCFIFCVQIDPPYFIVVSSLVFLFLRKMCGFSPRFSGSRPEKQGCFFNRRSSDGVRFHRSSFCWQICDFCRSTRQIGSFQRFSFSGAVWS